eukprot:851890-Alexandrium_andersonii.AAC.1
MLPITFLFSPWLELLTRMDVEAYILADDLKFFVRGCFWKDRLPEAMVATIRFFLAAGGRLAPD